MRDFIQLLRSALPEIIAGLVVAAILGILGLLYIQLGLWLVALLVIGVIILFALTVFIVSRRKKKITPLPSATAATRQLVKTTQDERQTILFVDDEIYFSASTVEALEEAGFTIEVATNGSQAISILQSDRPIDLLITDLILPYDDEKQGEAPHGGLKLIEEAKRLRGEIPIMCLSVVGSEEVSNQLRQLGVVEQLVKPVLPNEVVERVRLVLLSRQSPSQQELISQEIKRRKLELKSGDPNSRMRAIWALGELGHHDQTIIKTLEEVANADDGSWVRIAASEAISKIHQRLPQPAKGRKKKRVR